MKRCPICKKKFPDSEEFCPVHGVKLEEFRNSATEAWIAAGAGVLSWCLLITDSAGPFTYLLLSVVAVILPRGSEAAFPKWCAYITGYLMIFVLLIVIIWFMFR